MPSKIVRIDSILKQTKSSANSIRRSTNKKRTSVEGTLDRTQAPQLLTDATGTEPAVIKPEPDSNLNLQGAINHLCTVDPRFHALFQRFTPQPWTESGLAQPKNHFKSLVLGVLSQQVSGAAARSIGRRFVHLFVDPIHEVKLEVDIDPEVEDGPARLSDTVEVEDQVESMTNAVPANEALEDAYFPTPEQVAASEILYLKTAGLSLRKAEYVYGIANAFVSGSLNDDFFDTADDEAIKERLVSIRGLGPWSAEMFMMFSLKRWDIISPGDIGIQRGMSWWTGRNPKDKSKHNKNKASKYFTEADMIAASEAWRPYSLVITRFKTR